MLWLGHGLPYDTWGPFLIDLLVLLTLTQNLCGASARVGNAPFWSLALEEQLYMLYFPLLYLRRKLGWRATLGVVVTVNLTWIALQSQAPPAWQLGWSQAGPAYWLAWTLGALALEARLQKVQLPTWSQSWLLFAILLTVGANAPAAFRDLLITCSFVVLLRATLAVETRASLGNYRWVKAFVKLGEISYSVYLVHNLFFIASKRLLINVHLALPVIMTLRWGCGVLGGALFYLLLEKPALRRARKIAVPLLPAAPAN